MLTGKLIRYANNSKPPFPCRYARVMPCLETFQSRHELAVHHDEAHGKWVYDHLIKLQGLGIWAKCYGCGICKIGLYDEGDYCSHMNRRHANKEICSWNGCQIVHSTAHLEQCHAPLAYHFQLPDWHPCHDCRLSFPSRALLDEHTNEHKERESCSIPSCMAEPRLEGLVEHRNKAQRAGSRQAALQEVIIKDAAIVNYINPTSKMR